MPTKYVADSCSGGVYHKVKTLLKRSSVVNKPEVKVMKKVTHGLHRCCQSHRALYIAEYFYVEQFSHNRQGLEHFWKDRLGSATRNRCILRLEAHEK